MATPCNVSSVDEFFFSWNLYLPPCCLKSVMAKLLNVFKPAVCCFKWRFLVLSCSLITFYGCNQAMFPLFIYTPHLLHENHIVMFQLTKVHFLNVDRLSLKSWEKIRITTCTWLVVWRSKSSLLRRHFKYFGEVRSASIKSDLSQLWGKRKTG